MGPKSAALRTTCARSAAVLFGLTLARPEAGQRGTEVRKLDRVRWQERIVVTPDLHHGDPCIKGTRIPVAMIVGSLADGMTPQEIRDSYPQLADEDILAALAYAADILHQDVLVPLSA